MSSVLVKSRAGNRSAQLVQSVPVRVGRGTRMVPMCIGAVSAGADFDTGAGFRFKPGYSLEQLDAVARKKVETWLAIAAAGNVAVTRRVTLVALDDKLEELLGLAKLSAADCVRAIGAHSSTSSAPVGFAATSMHSVPAIGAAKSPLDQLEDALMAAVQDLAEQVKVARESGAVLTTLRHVGVEPAGKSALDKLQARANRLRREVLPRFEDACKTMALMVSKSAKPAE